MAWLSMALWLSISTTGPATTEHPVIEKLRQEHPGLFKAPEVSPWPNDMPRSLLTPRQARCFDRAGHELGLGSWVPRALGRVVQSRLLDLELYPGRAQGVIDAIVPRVLEAVIDRAAAAPPEGYRLSTVVMWTLIGLGVGAAATAGAVLTVTL